MYASKVSEWDMQQALIEINKKYSDNIAFRFLEKRGSKYTFRLQVNHSRSKGSRFHIRQGKGHRSTHACWHVHGDFFDALFAINPDAVIRSSGKKITRDYGNWEDRDIGSAMSPLYYSESCLCNAFDMFGVTTADEFNQKLTQLDVFSLIGLWDDMYGAFRAGIVKYAKHLKDYIKSLSVEELRKLWDGDTFKILVARYGSLELAPILVLSNEQSPEISIIRRRLAGRRA